MEHHSNIVPWQLLCEETGAKLRYLTLTESAELSLDELDSVLAEGRVKLVAVAHVSNVLGTINPVAEIVRRARAAGAVTVIDGAQAVPQLPLDLREIDADFYAWTGHKALGPTIGLLHGRRELLDGMRPFLGGGHMISRVEREHSTWNELPVQVRGRHLGGHRGGRAGRGGGVSRRDRHGADPRPRARPDGVRS